MYPILLQAGEIQIPSYFAMISLALIVGQLWLMRRAPQKNLETSRALDLSLMLMVTGFLGARVFHMVYEYPQYYWQDLTRAFEIWKGGFVFFGGALPAFFAAYWYTRREKLDWREWADLFAPIFLVVYGLGRVASFLSGSCYGKPTDLPWGVIYPEGVEAPPGIALHPAALYEALWSCLAAGVLLAWEKKRPPTGRVFDCALIIHGIGRIGLESMRDDYRGETLLGFSVSSWISLALILAGLARLSGFFDRLGSSKSTDHRHSPS